MATCVGFIHTHKKDRNVKAFFDADLKLSLQSLRQRKVDRAYLFHKINQENSTCNELSKNPQATINLISKGA